MAYIENFAPTTELEAVNTLLATIGEAPIEDMSSSQPDVAMAVQVLKNTTRELQSQPWKFNTEFDLQLSPDSEDYSFTEPDGTSKTINIWHFPLGILAWQLSKVSDQIGSKAIDVTVRPSKQYKVSDNFVNVFYDRNYNRDGFPADERDYLWIDAVWAFDFSKLPETARRLIIILAARRFAAQVVGSEKLVGFTEQDERIAWRGFIRDQGMKDKRNFLQHPETDARIGLSRPTSLLAYGYSLNRRP